MSRLFLGNGAAVTPTAADTLDFLRECPDLKPKQREDRIGAVHALIRICGPEMGSKRRCDAIRQAAKEVPMDCQHLNGLLFKHPPMKYGISLRRFDNVVSLNRDVLRRLGRHAPELPRAEDLSPAWQELHTSLTIERRKGMIAFMGYCTLSDILPLGVNAETVQILRDLVRHVDVAS